MNRYKAHQILLKKNTLAVQQAFPSRVRIFDRHVGKFLPLAFIKNVLAGKWRINEWGKFIISINQKGMADQYLLLKTKHGLLHIEIETKSGKAVQNPDQKNWEEFINMFGGCYILARCPEDIINIIQRIIENE